MDRINLGKAKAPEEKTMPAKVLVGTASWTDPGFIADWYPKEIPASRRLMWYASQFNMVELNSSFYAIPKQQSVEKWCRETPPGFVFDVKLHKLLSRHATDIKLLPPELRAKAKATREKVELTPTIEKAVAKRFLQEIEPFCENGKLGALLLQLSPSFRPRTHKLEELDNLFELLEDYPVAVELRNADWVSEAHLADTTRYFRKRHLTFVSVDAPEAAHFMIMPGTDVVTNPRLAYMRLHGRNARGYIRGRTVADRFNYDYSHKELKQVAERVSDLAEEAREVHVVYNNNASNYAPKAAEDFKEIVAEDYPELDLGPQPEREEQMAFGNTR
jgi:uncharacterized protein YecE (DUF72 family)